jgi:UDP-glucose 4-epimerase
LQYVVIGSAGFIGAYLTRALQAEGVDRTVVDLSDSTASKKLGAIVDGKSCVFCANGGPGPNGWDASANLRILEPFLAVADRCAHVTYLSSDMIYPYDVPVTEDLVPAPDTVYGEMHLAREKALSDVVGNRLLIARLAQVYGPGDSHNAYGPCRMLSEALLGGPIVVKGRGEERRDHIHIQDTVKLLTSLIRSAATGVFNIATGQAVSFEDVAKYVQSVVPSDINYEPRSVPIKHRDFDVSKLMETFPDFRPQTMNLNDMIELSNG